MRRIIDYANFGANHVGGMGSRRAVVCCIHLLPSSRWRARSLPVQSKPDKRTLTRQEKNVRLSGLSA